MGQFENDVVTKWLTSSEKDRDMKLTEDFAYLDDAGKRWEAVTNTIVNGASIPSFLWSVVGSPFVGDYRRAAVLHDAYYRDHRGETKSDVDDMFRDAMLDDGVSPFRAGYMYAAVVAAGGSSWDGMAAVPEAAPAATRGVPAPPAAAMDWEDFQRWYESEGHALSKDELDQALATRYGPY